MFQVMLVNAVKDVASALRDLIGATKNAAGKSPVDPTVRILKESAKVTHLQLVVNSIYNNNNKYFSLSANLCHHATFQRHSFA